MMSSTATLFWTPGKPLALGENPRPALHAERRPQPCDSQRSREVIEGTAATWPCGVHLEAHLQAALELQGHLSPPQTTGGTKLKKLKMTQVNRNTLCSWSERIHNVKMTKQSTDSMYIYINSNEIQKIPQKRKNNCKIHVGP